MSRLQEALRCPVCGAALTAPEGPRGGSYLCQGPKKHCFDRAGSGYVNLAGNHQGGGDSKEAVRSRRAFLDSGAYAPIADGLAALLKNYLPAGSAVIDAGCGEGFYTGRLARAGFDVGGLDLSRPAVEAAAKRGLQEGLPVQYSVASIFELPYLDEAADGVVSIFAPVSEREFLRVLRPGGVLAVVGAGPEHLLQLKETLYDTTYLNEERADLPAGMEALELRRICYDLPLQGEAQIGQLFSMTPYYWRTKPSDKERLVGLDALTVRVDVELRIFRKPL